MQKNNRPVYNELDGRLFSCPIFSYEGLIKAYIAQLGMSKFCFLGATIWQSYSLSNWLSTTRRLKFAIGCVQKVNSVYCTNLYSPNNWESSDKCRRPFRIK